jgi:acyl-CoA thioester hydrolase
MLEGFRFSHSIRVRYSEIDGQMVVLNSHYMNYIVIGNTEYFRNLGLNTSEESYFDISLVKSTLNFKSPVYFDDIINIYVKITQLGNKSYTANYAIERAATGEVAFTAENIYVSYSVALKSSVTIPDYVREKITSFEGLPPD